MRTTYVILTCEAYLPTRCKAIRDTWLKNVSNYVFLSAHPNEAENVLGWNTPDNYESCALKYIEFFRNHTLDSDWIVFCDDDTFVFPARVESMLAQLDPNRSLYIGFDFPIPHWSTTIGGMSGGAGFVLSRSTYQRLCAYIRTAENPWVSMYTDVSIANWLLVQLHDVEKVIDYRFRPRVCQFPEQFRYAFTFHYVTPDLMKDYYQKMKTLGGS